MEEMPREKMIQAIRMSADGTGRSAPGLTAESVMDEFRAVRQTTPEIEALLLSYADGRVIAEFPQSALDGRRVAAMANSFLTLGETLGKEMELTQTDHAMVCTRSGNIVLIRIGADNLYTLTAMAKTRINLAVLLFTARECAQRIVRLTDSGAAPLPGERK